MSIKHKIIERAKIEHKPTKKRKAVKKTQTFAIYHKIYKNNNLNIKDYILFSQ